MAVPIVCICGTVEQRENDLIERVIPELVRADTGWRRSSMPDTGSISIRKAKIAGATNRPAPAASSIVSKGSIAMFADVSDQMKVEDVRTGFWMPSYDLIIAEGWKHEGYPKIVIVRDQIGEIALSLRKACWRWCRTSLSIGSVPIVRSRTTCQV